MPGYCWYIILPYVVLVIRVVGEPASLTYLQHLLWVSEA